MSGYLRIAADKHYLSDPDQLDLIPGVGPALKRLQDAGFLLIIVTNQSGIGRGYYTEENMHAVNRRLMWSMWGAQDPLDAVTLDLQCVGHLAAGADAQEGIKSFFEKRAPVFPLRPSKDMPPFGPWTS